MPDYVALDLHRDYVHVCRLVPHPKGAQMRHSQFPNTLPGWQRFIDENAHPQMRVAFEVTGNAFEAHDLLSPHVGEVLVTKAEAARAKGTGRKTDRADTERLVVGLAEGTLPAVWVPPVQVRHLRDLLSAREGALKHQKALGNRIRALFRRAMMPIPVGCDVHAWLTKNPDALKQLNPIHQKIALSHWRRYQAVGDEVEALTAEIASAVQENPMCRQLLTIPGVSLLTAAHIYAYLGDPARFPSAKQVSRYAGLDPSVHASGERHYTGAISKHGCRRLRAVLVEAAHVVVRSDRGPLGQFFQRLRARKGYAKSIVALARKLVVVAWKIMLTGEAYRGEREESTQRKVRRIARTAEKVRDWDALFRTLVSRPDTQGAPAVSDPDQGADQDRPREKVPIPA